MSEIIMFKVLFLTTNTYIDLSLLPVITFKHDLIISAMQGAISPLCHMDDLMFDLCVYSE